MRTLLLCTLLLLPACALLDSGDGEGAVITPLGNEIVLVNQTGETIYYLALDEETAHLVDPIPCFEPSGAPLPALADGATAALTDIEGYEPGEDLRLFIYAVRDQECQISSAATLAHLVAYPEVTDAALRQHKGRIVLDAL